MDILYNWAFIIFINCFSKKLFHLSSYYPFKQTEWKWLAYNCCQVNCNDYATDYNIFLHRIINEQTKHWFHTKRPLLKATIYFQNQLNKCEPRSITTNFINCFYTSEAPSPISINIIFVYISQSSRRSDDHMPPIKKPINHKMCQCFEIDLKILCGFDWLEFGAVGTQCFSFINKFIIQLMLRWLFFIIYLCMCMCTT